MPRMNVTQNNYGRWTWSVGDDLGNTLDAGNQFDTANEATAEAQLWLQGHPDVASAGLSWFRDGSTGVTKGGMMPIPKIDFEGEAQAAGLRPEMPAGWKPLSLPHASGSTYTPAATPTAEVAPDEGMSEQNPLIAQRTAISKVLAES